MREGSGPRWRWFILEQNGIGAVRQRHGPERQTRNRLAEARRISGDAIAEQGGAATGRIVMARSLVIRHVRRGCLAHYRHHHAVMARHISHHLMRWPCSHLGAHFAWLRHGFKAKGKRGDEPKSGRERAKHEGKYRGSRAPRQSFDSYGSRAAFSSSPEIPCRLRKAAATWSRLTPFERRPTIM